MEESPGGNVPDTSRIGDLEAVDDDGTILIEVDNTTGTYTVSLRGSVYDTYKNKGKITVLSVVIESLLPNPPGLDAQLEEVTIRNNGSQRISLVDWILEDRSARTWDLSSLGLLAPNQSRTIRREDQPMSLNNSGDEIRLLDAAGFERDRFEYTNSQEGDVINTGH